MSPVQQVKLENSRKEKENCSTISISNFAKKSCGADYVGYRPDPPEELMQCLIEYLKQKYNGPQKVAVDLGCGTGQFTFPLKNRFDSVLGTDINPVQILEAKKQALKLKLENVTFETHPANIIPLEDSSVQLVTICEAAHFMDMEIVYPEIQRVLQPNGVLALVGYFVPRFRPSRTDDEHKSDAINKAFSVIEMKPCSNRPYWTQAAVELDNEYSNVKMPFADFQKKRGFFQEKKVRIADILDLIRSFTPYKTYVLEKGDEAGTGLLQTAVNEVVSILNQGREKQMSVEEVKAYEFIQSFHFFMLLGRKTG